MSFMPVEAGGHDFMPKHEMPEVTPFAEFKLGHFIPGNETLVAKLDIPNLDHDDLEAIVQSLELERQREYAMYIESFEDSPTIIRGLE